EPERDEKNLGMEAVECISKDVHSQRHQRECYRQGGRRRQLVGHAELISKKESEAVGCRERRHQPIGTKRDGSDCEQGIEQVSVQSEVIAPRVVPEEMSMQPARTVLHEAVEIGSIVQSLKVSDFERIHPNAEQRANQTRHAHRATQRKVNCKSGKQGGYSTEFIRDVHVVRIS